MFGKLMNGYFYGKSGKGDFTPDDLPKNRWELFWAMLRVRFSALSRLNLMTIVAFLPYLLIILINVLNMLTSLNNALAYQEAVLSGAEITEEAFSPAIVEVYQKYTADNVFQLGKYTQDLTQACLWSVVLFLIPAILVTGPVEAGIAYVCRNWARDEHAFIWGDFKDAVKDNWKQGLGISAITSVMPVIMFVCYSFYSEMSKESVVYMVPQMLVLLIGVIWWLGLVFFYPLMVSYKMTFGQLIKNGLMLGVGRLPQALGFRLLCLVPVLICAFLLFFTGIGMYGILVICVYYLICGITLTRFVYASFTNAVFDRFINSKIEGVKINRGLSEESDDDDEEPEAEKQDE